MLDDRRLVRLGRARRLVWGSQGGTAGRAEARVRQMLHATTWTMGTTWCATADAKPGTCGMVHMIDVLACRTAPGLSSRQRARDHLGKGAPQRLRRPRGARTRLLLVTLTRCGRHRYRRHEAIAVAVERLDDPLLLPAIAYGLKFATSL